MIRHKFTYEGKTYDIRANDYVEFSRKVLQRVYERPLCPYTVREWFNEFLVLYKADKADRTLTSYRQRFRKHIEPSIGNLFLHQVTHAHCQRIMANMSGYSKDTIGKIKDDLVQLFSKAVKNGYLDSSPASDLEVPTGGGVVRRALTDEEIFMTLETYDKSKKGIQFLIMMFCGLRPHETALLQGKDVQGNMLHIRGVKTDDADRWVPIPDELLNRLPSFEPEEYICKSVSGKFPTSEKNRDEVWKEFKVMAEEYCSYRFADDVVPYCYRHTYGTSLQEAGLPINVIRELLGHSNIQTTQTYLDNRCHFLVEQYERINWYFNDLGCHSSATHVPA